MSNETIVKKGEQVKAIDVELEDVKQQMEILKAKADMLTSDKNRLTKEIVELKHGLKSILSSTFIKYYSFILYNLIISQN